MAESIAQRMRSLSDKGDARHLELLFNAILADITAVRSAIAGILVGSTTHDFASLVDGAGESVDVTVTGAALGDRAIVSLGVDTVDMTLTADVTAADTVTVRLQNESGSTADLASTSVAVTVIPSSFAAPAALTTIS